MKAVIMAGGLGTRLLSLTGNEIPKAMAVLGGKPIIVHQIESLRMNGITDITLIVGHLKEKLIDFLGKGEKFGVNVDYIIEDEPLGKAGALFFLKEKIKNDFLFLYGDIIFDIDISRMHKFHKNNAATITLYTHPNSHPYDSDLVFADKTGRILKILKAKEERPEFYKNCVNSGIFMINSKALDYLTEPKKMNMERDFVRMLIENGERVMRYNFSEYIKDVGTPDRIKSVEEDIRHGVVYGRNLVRKQKAVFLDRDGTINKDIPFISRLEDLHILENSAAAISLINRSGYLGIVITNQPVIARGEVTFEGLETIHNKMETELGKKGVYVDDIFFCPHHPHKGYQNEVAELKIECECRKPKGGMLFAAAEKYNIDLNNSWTIGDKAADILAGKAAETKTALIVNEQTEPKDIESNPDIKGGDLLDLVKQILKL